MKKIPVAYQVYSAREEAERNLDAVFAELARLGYDGVEFAGFYGHSAAEINRLLQKHGLKAISSHVAMQLIEADMYGVLDFHKAIGCEYIAIPYLDEETRPGGKGFGRMLRTIQRFGARCREMGIQLLYHNHDFEFVQISGQYGLDFLYDAVGPELLATEIDTCWVKYAGLNPADYIRQYANRCPVVHLKDYVGSRGEKSPYALIGKDENEDHSTDVPFEFRPFGHGSQDAAAIITASVESGAKWFVVEQDLSVGRTPLEAAGMSIDTLRRLGVK